MNVRIDCGTPDLDLVLVEEPDHPLRIVRFGRPGTCADLPPGQPVLELVTVDSGHLPSTGRLTGGAAGARLRHRSHHREQTAGWTRTTIVLAQEGGLQATLVLAVPEGIAAVRAHVEITNPAGPARVLRSVAGLALMAGPGPDAVTDPDRLWLSRADSEWVGESRWRTQALRAAGLPRLSLPLHGQDARGAITVASRGGWPTNHALPAGVLSTAADPQAGTGALAWQIEHNGGWRWEIAEHRTGVGLVLSGPTDLDHQWSARLEAGDSFSTVPVLLAAGAHLGDAVAALTDLRRAARPAHEDRQLLRVVYNDYMNTLMGDPTTERLIPLVDAAAEAGAEVFCIDAGWYDDTGDWWYGVGSWEPSKVRFPEGISQVLDRIRDRDMIPGLWLEPEVVGVDDPVATALPEDAFFRRGGVRVVEHGRYHLDLSHPAARAHLDAVIDRLVDDLGIGYVKLDYNVDPGPGTDADGLPPGAGLLRHNRAQLAWVRSVLERHPRLILENCSSGGMRADPASLAVFQLQSTSDQQDPLRYPPIAASAPLTVPLEQAGNWAYPQPEESPEQIAFTLACGMLGRMYLSGFWDRMTVAQQSLVAEAVAAHKRLRPALAQAHAGWPLGLDQWDAGWVAQQVTTADVSYLTLWRRPGAPERINLLLDDLRGFTDVVAEVVFPTRLDPWRVDWDAATGRLEVTATTEAPTARTFRISRGPVLAPVEVDAEGTTGPVHGGATGMLYGLAEPAVPSAAVLAGVAPRTMAQKPPGGQQHPGGDAAELAAGYLARPGTEMLVYLQDALTRWPYEQIDAERYRTIVAEAVDRMVAGPHAERVVWVPFNEGDWIWYEDWSPQGRDRFLADWDAVHAVIRAHQPDARIAGPNESRYHHTRIRDFLRHTAAHGTLPDVMAWHELQPSSLEVFDSHLNQYRCLEAELGIDPLPVNIDEYANRRDMAVPAQLLQWIELLETGKVDGDLAYWTTAGNLSDHAVNSNQVNGGWWLLHWYAGLTGAAAGPQARTLPVTVAHPRVRDSLRALAVADGSAVSVLVGGGADGVRLRVRGLTGRDVVRVRVQQIAWTGPDGPCQGPRTVGDTCRRVHAGTVQIDLPGGDVTAVHRIDITPDGGGEPAPADPAPVVVGTEAAVAHRVRTVRHGDDPQEYTGWGRELVTGLPEPDSSLSFPVTIAQDGRYRLAITYGTPSRPGRLTLAVDDAAPVVLELAATLSPSYLGRHELDLALTAGEHRIVLRGGPTDADPDRGTDGDVAVDRISLDLLRPTEQTEQTEQTEPSRRYDAVLAEPGAGALRCWAGARSGAGLIRLTGAADLTFTVATRRSAAHRVELLADGPGRIQLELTDTGDADVPVGEVDLPAGAGLVTTVLTLPAGISRIRIRRAGAEGPGGNPNGSVEVHRLVVTELAAPAAGFTAGAEDLDRTGDVRLVPGAGGPMLAGLENGTATLALPEVPAGAHLLSVGYTNADLRSGHEYNTDAVVRRLRARAGAGAGAGGIVLACRYQYHWDNRAQVEAVLTVTGPVTELVLDGAPGAGPAPLVTGVSLAPVIVVPAACIPPSGRQ